MSYFSSLFGCLPCPCCNAVRLYACLVVDSITSDLSTWVCAVLWSGFELVSVEGGCSIVAEHLCLLTMLMAAGAGIPRMWSSCQRQPAGYISHWPMISQWQPDYRPAVVQIVQCVLILMLKRCWAGLRPALHPQHVSSRA